MPKEINQEAIGQKQFVSSHIIIKTSLIRKIGAVLFSIYPKNIFSFFEQRGLVERTNLGINKRVETFVRDNGEKINKETYEKIKNYISENYEPQFVVNRTIFDSGLDRLENGTVLKLLVFQKFPLRGHSLLIKKIDSNKFTFFDPNTGIEKGLTKEDLALEIDSQLKTLKGNDIYLTSADQYLQDLNGKV